MSKVNANNTMQEMNNKVQGRRSEVELPDVSLFLSFRLFPSRSLIALLPGSCEPGYFILVHNYLLTLK